MTQEDKQLLLRDFCERLPYGIKLGFENSDLILVPEEFNIYTKQLSTNQIYPKVDRAVIKHIYDVWNYRPYLRPMSSMTDEEETLFRCELPAIAKTDAQLVAMRMELFLKGHLDFNHLIEKGLALEAKEGMYKTE
jgi:hypothetical protein